jgi:hypothetical protein
MIRKATASEKAKLRKDTVPMPFKEGQEQTRAMLEKLCPGDNNREEDRT